MIAAQLACRKPGARVFSRPPLQGAIGPGASAPADDTLAGRTNDNAGLTLPSRTAAPAMPDTPDLPATPSPDLVLPATELQAAADLAAAAPESPAVHAAADLPDDACPDAQPELAHESGPGTLAPADPAPAAPRAPARPDLSPAACADLLKQHFPALFGGPPKPLKLRIQVDINAQAPGVFSKAALSAFFRRHTTSTAYLIALGKAESRYDLDGQPAGELSEEHRQLARDELTRRRQVTREREQLAQTQQRAQAQAQQAEEAERQRAQQQERQSRLGLLRDFERTTLTLANFCVLKGIKPEALTPLLDQARKEAAEAPPPPARFDDRRGPMGPRQDGPRHDGPRNDGPRNDGPRNDGPRNDSARRDGPRQDARPGGRPDQRPQNRPAGAPRGDRRGGKPPGPSGAA